MADFRRKEYRGSLLLVQECGPVDIVVDTEDKTVTPSLAKADSSYSVAGGGGGLPLSKIKLNVSNAGETTDCYIQCTDNDGFFGGIVETNDGWYSEDNFFLNQEIEKNCYILDKIVVVTPDSSADPTLIASVKGDARIVEDGGNYSVEVTGDCEIVFVGSSI